MLGAAAVSVLVGAGTAAAVGVSVLVPVAPFVVDVSFFLLLNRLLSLSMNSEAVGKNDELATAVPRRLRDVGRDNALPPAISAG